MYYAVVILTPHMSVAISLRAVEIHIPSNMISDMYLLIR